MSKLTQDRDTKRRDGVLFGFEAAEQIYCGAMVAMNATGKLVAATASGGVVIGVAQETGKAGDMISVRRGVFNFVNNQGDLTLADIGSECVVVDDQTVGKAGAATQDSTTTTTSAVAGILVDLNADGAWIKI